MKIVLASSLNVLPENTVPVTHQGDFYSNLLYCLGFSNDDMPIADLLRQFHHLEGAWLVASPIHWQATHNDVMVMSAGENLGLSEEAGQAWFQAFDELVTHWGFKAKYHNAYTWLVQAHKSPVIHAQPVSQLIHQSMMLHLQALDNSLYWQKFLTETQLFFSAHILNRQRGRQPLNGVWLWGAGHLSQSEQLILVQDDLLLPMANLLSKQTAVIKSGQRYADDTLLIVRVLDDELLAKISSNQSHTWYWNNLAYQSKPRSKIKQFLTQFFS